jgi:hypothetical protein
VEVNWIELDGLPTFDREPRVDGANMPRRTGHRGAPLHRPLAAVKARAAYLTKKVRCYWAWPTTLLRNCLTFLFNCFFLFLFK